MQLSEKRLKKFKQRLSAMLSSEQAENLIQALQKPPEPSVRYNSCHVPVARAEGTPVPWCVPWGRFWQNTALPPSATLAYGLGDYYIQESSAMLAVSTAAKVTDFSGRRILDLCAAPGGKTTQAAELAGQGIVVANEINQRRLRALIWNINRHRLNNTLVTSLSPERLAAKTGPFFDIVLVDAPCSGEGLLQMRKLSLNKWSEKNILFCAKRQRAILNQAHRMLRPGGTLVYSTCTFAREENEDQVDFMISRGYRPVTLPAEPDAAGAVSDNPEVRRCSRRIFPHQQPGAGAFVSVLSKSPDSTISPAILTEKSALTNLDHLQSAFPFVDFRHAPGYFLEKEHIIHYVSRPRIPEILLAISLQPGVPVADRLRRKNIFFGSVQAGHPDFCVEVSRNQARDYLKGMNPLDSEAHGFFFPCLNRRILGPLLISRDRSFSGFPPPLQTGI